MSKVSIIIPTFNRPHLLPRAVESAFGAGSDVEVIVVDDASSDGTAKVCAGLPGVKYVRLDRNQGVAGARNVGLMESRGDFIAFLDDDDLRLPGSLDYQLSLLEAEPEAGFVAGGVLLADQHCVPTGIVAFPRAESGDLFWRVLELDLHLIPGSVLVRKSCFFEIGIFNRHLAGIDDWDMWTRIAEVRPILVDHQEVCIYRSATPASGQGSSTLARHLHAAVKHQTRLLSLPRAQGAPAWRRRAVRQITRRRVADTLSWRAAEELPRGAFRFAAANFFVALRLSPQWAARPAHLRVLWQSAAARLRTPREPPPAPGN
ncbi:MAG: glycosyltransferase family 2 protein [Acidobacteriota bacterium]|nr:glycosyltransferase family 2 protein [Acidobacteriota bacterium]